MVSLAVGDVIRILEDEPPRAIAIGRCRAAGRAFDASTLAASGR
jgi:hypothetical protein